MKTSVILFIAVASCNLAHAEILQVSRTSWDGLSPEEQATIQIKHVVQIFENGSFGLVIDAQGADRSDPGTYVGAALGSAVAQAAYLDRAFSGKPNYSATTQLATGILGGLLGSTLDRPATQQYQFRYALKLSNGEIQYADAIMQEPFRHPPGVCLSLPTLRPISQSICNDGPDDLRRKYVIVLPAPTNATIVSSPHPAEPEAPVDGGSSATLVQCRLGSLAPVSTTAQKCNAIGGTLQ
jgi:hypothetical protein